MSSAGRRARRELRRFVAHHRLLHVPVLRLEPDNPNLLHEFETYIDRLRYHAGDFVWLGVPEYDKVGRPHIHFFTDGTVDGRLMQDQWVKPFHSPDTSFFGIRIVRSIEGIQKYSNYSSKNFDLPANQRPTRRRYRVSQHPRPTPIVFHNVTKQDLDLIRIEIQQITGSHVRSWDTDNFLCPQVDYWEPTPATSEAVIDLLNSYKPT